MTTRIRGMAVLIAGIAAFSACNGAEPEPTAPPDSSPEKTSTPTVTDTPTPSPTQPSLPAGWTTCSNEAHGYTIGYPEEWHTASVNRNNACRWFDPDHFEVEPATEPPPTAINVNPTERPYEKARAQLQDSPRHELETFEPVTIGGLEAVRYEREQTENLLYPAGTRTYGYLFDHDGSAFYLETRKIPDSNSDYEGNKQILDEAARTVEFSGGA